MNHPMTPLQAGPPKNGMPTIVKVFIVIGAVMFVILAASFVFGLVVGLRRASSGSAARGTSLPPVARHVPEHSAALLDGCSTGDVDLIVDGIGSAIDVGAPLYNAGDFAGCYHLYDGAAADLERRLSPTCPGPVQALVTGQARAAKLSTPSAQAWAMRDAFDGLLAVTQRQR